MKSSSREVVTKKSLSDQVYKPGEVNDDDSRLVLTDLGPEEQFAGKVLKSLKDKIDEARSELQQLEQEINQKQQEAKNTKEEILGDARSEAEQIVEEAEEKAQELLDSREEEVEQARQEGYDDGYEDGQDQARKDTAELMEQAENMLDEARRERRAYVEEHEPQLIRLATTLAERIVRETIELDPDVISRVVRDAIAEVREVREITIVLHPDDIETIRSIVDELHKEHSSLEHIDLAENSRLQPGSCRIRTDFGDIDATLSGQLEHYETLLSRMDGPDAEAESGDSDSADQDS